MRHDHRLSESAVTVAVHSHYLKNHPGLLQEVGPHVGADDAVLPVEADLSVLPKAAAVVVPGGLCVSNRLEGRHAPVAVKLWFQVTT